MSANHNERRLRNVVASGDRLQILETMLEMMAERFDTCSERDSAGISRQIQSLTDEIQQIRDADDLKSDGFDDFVDELGI